MAERLDDIIRLVTGLMLQASLSKLLYASNGIGKSAKPVTSIPLTSKRSSIRKLETKLAFHRHLSHVSKAMGPNYCYYTHRPSQLQTVHQRTWFSWATATKSELNHASLATAPIDAASSLDLDKQNHNGSDTPISTVEATPEGM